VLVAIEDKRVKRGVLLVLALGAGATMAACGGSNPPGVASLGHRSGASTTTGGTTTGSGRSANSSNGGGTGPSGATVGMGGVTVKFSACIRAHGFPNFPDPNSQGQINFHVDPSSSSFQTAQQACAKYAGASGQPPSPAQQARILANALKFSECMRAHGVTNFPDPRTGPGGRGIAISFKAGQGGLSPNSAVYKKAQEKCQGKLGGLVGKRAPAGSPSGAS
jgi:hypothetical protein